MTSSELARDKLKYWKLIGRAKKVDFPIPEHWMKYGSPPTNIYEISKVYMETTQDIFDVDDMFYKFLKR